MRKIKSLTRGYVCCDKCYKAGQKHKPDIEHLFALEPGGKIHGLLCKTLITSAIKDFYNGWIYKVPLCCNIYYCSMILKNLRPALISDKLRDNVEFSCYCVKLTNREKEYIENIKKA